MFHKRFHGSTKLFFDPIRSLGFGLIFTNSNRLNNKISRQYFVIKIFRFRNSRFEIHKTYNKFRKVQKSKAKVYDFYYSFLSNFLILIDYPLR